MAVGVANITSHLSGLSESQPSRGVVGPSPSFQAEVARAERVHRSDGTAKLVEPSRTSLSGSQASQAIRQAYREVTGEEPSDGMLAILTSHWALETGQGKSMYNYNFAGIKGRGPDGLTTVMKTREGHGESAIHIRDGFRAYGSAEAGAKDYISLLVRRYPSAVDAAKAEQPERFAQELKARGYFTGDATLYAKGVTRLANRVMEYGFDAVGSTAGPLASQPKPITPYFDSTPSPIAASSPYGRMAQSAPSEPYNPWHTLDAVFNPSTTSVEALTDEMSRTALLIAAQRGAV